MPYTTLVAGSVITASWANASVRDQTVTPFASAAARTSAVTSPPTGMLTYNVATKRYEGYEGAAWEPIQMRVQARKTLDETLSSTTTLQNDDELTWPVQINAFYTLDLHLRYNSSAAADMKIGWSMPAGAGMVWSLIANDSTLVATITGDYDQTNTPALGGNSTALWAHITGTFATVATAGSLTLQWAQNTNTAVNTSMLAHSYGFLTRVL